MRSSPPAPWASAPAAYSCTWRALKWPAAQSLFKLSISGVPGFCWWVLGLARSRCRKEARARSGIAVVELLDPPPSSATSELGSLNRFLTPLGAPSAVVTHADTMMKTLTNNMTMLPTNNTNFERCYEQLLAMW